MTLFERIIAKEIPATIHYEDEHCIVFEDIAPQAPIHLLIVPRQPIARVECARSEHAESLGALLLAAGKVARKLGIDAEGGAGGFRLVINNGSDAGESVPHLHVHLLAGRALNWPPG